MIDLPKIPKYLKKPLPIVVDLGLTPYPFLLVKPMSMQHCAFIRQGLLGAFSIADEVTIDNYETLARYFYDIYYPPRYRYQWLMLARAVVPESYNEAHVFLLHPIADYARLIDFKYSIRQQIGLVPYQFCFYGEPMETEHNHIHVADEADLHREFNLLVQLCLSG